LKPEKPKTAAPMSPGDEAKPGTPGTGEDICPECNGRGKTAQGEPCRNCAGTGRIVRGIGGA
jgi:RecJ-like exonuclease